MERSTGPLFGPLDDRMTTIDEQNVALDALDERYAALRLVQPRELAWLRESVARDGLLHPLIVNGTEDGKLVVLDGFKRLLILREREQSEAWVRVVHLSETAAQAAIVMYNAAQHAGLSELEEGWVVRSLVREHKLAQVEVAKLLGRHKSWVCRRLLLVERLDESVQADMRVGLVSASVARELARLPRGNQPEVGKVVREHGLTSRQAGELCSLYLGAQHGNMAAEELREVLGDPLRFVGRKTPNPPPKARDPRLSDAGEEIRRRLLSFDRAATGVRSILSRYPTTLLLETDHRVLSELGTGVAERGRDALERLTQMTRASALDAADGRNDDKTPVSDQEPTSRAQT